MECRWEEWFAARPFRAVIRLAQFPKTLAPRTKDDKSCVLQIAMMGRGEGSCLGWSDT